MPANLLLIDDDQDAILTLSKALSLKLSNLKIHAAGNTEKALQLLNELKPQVVICDLYLDPAHGIESGFEMLRKTIEHDTTCRVIMLTGHSDKANGIRALTLGAASFLAKPADLELLVALCKDALYQCELRRELAQIKNDKSSNLLNCLIGNSTKSQELKEKIKLAAANNQSILITGETGTGKGLCAQLIHKLSNRSEHRFVRYQPNFTAAEMVNSDLFGHVKGAFTGADSDRKGLLQEANTGTLFLDEIDELPVQTQIALLGTLQDRTFRSLGSNLDQSSNFRLLCACNRPIEESIQNGRLRQDFYHRIAHLTINIEPLRQRKEDILSLAEYFLKELNEKEQLAVFAFDAEANQSLTEYNWPGNVRELQAHVASAAYKAAFEGSTVITARLLDLKTVAEDNNICGSQQSNNLNYLERVRDFKKSLVNQALKTSDNNQAQAARLLGVNRSTLSRILSEI